MTTSIRLHRARGQAQQQHVLDAWLASRPEPAAELAVIAEAAITPLDAPDDLEIVRLAAGCVCCLGQVPLRVSLTRLLRRRPRALLMMVAADEHLPRLRALLASGELGSIELQEA